jgi:hypothetical protein
MSSTDRTPAPHNLTNAQNNLAPGRRYRVLAICAHPVQYHAPVLRRMASRADLDLHVAYCTLSGAEAAHDPRI